MRFAKWTYLVAGVYGLLVLVPQYFLESTTSVNYPPAINHPEYYYGFIGVAVAWQVAFLIISRDPKRFRRLMIAAMIEKFSYVVAVFVLYGQDRVAVAILVTALIDLILGTLFTIAFIKTRS